MFPFTVTSNAVSIFIDGRPVYISKDHPNFISVIEAIDAGDKSLIRQLADVKATVKAKSLGRVEILDDTIRVDDVEVEIDGLIDRILEMVNRGSKAVDGYIRFLDNLLLNPSRTSVQELYLFLEACDLPITDDGCFLAYKRVRNDYTDIHSGTFDNSVGQVCQMARNAVDDDRNRTCSAGLHFCSYDYLPHFGTSSGNRVVVVRINPADVVSIPSDYNNAKGRTWKYEVVGEIEDWVNDRITSYYTEEYSEGDPDYAEMSDDELDFQQLKYDIMDAVTDCQDHSEVVDYLNELVNINTISGYGCSAVESDDGVEHEIDVEVTTNDGVTFTIETSVVFDYDLDANINVEVDVEGATGNFGELNAAKVRAIRTVWKDRFARSETTLTAIGKHYGVDRETIARAMRGDTWKDVTVS